MTKWMNNFLKVERTGESGKCPLCGSLDTDYTFVSGGILKERGFLDVWCNSCNKRGTISCKEVPKGRKVILQE